MPRGTNVRVLSGPSFGCRKNMPDFVSNILVSPWLGTLIAVLGIVVAFTLYRAAEIGARPVYQRRSFRLIGFNQAELPQAVEILYRGARVERLTKSRVIFWNSGKKIVHGSDIVLDDALRCELSPEALALEVQIVKHTRDANKFTATIDQTCRNRVVLSFDYLDPQDGAVIEVLHTDSIRDPTIKGTIRGVPNGILDWGSTYEWSQVLPSKRSTKFVIFFMRVFPIVAVVVGLGILFASFVATNSFLTFLDSPISSSMNFGERTLIGIVGFAYSIPGAVALWISRRRYPKALRYT